MRFKQQIPACLRLTAAAVLTLGLFASARPVFASGQVPAATSVPAPQPTGSALPLSADEAVRLALENNLGLRADRLSPQLQALALIQTRAAYAPTLFSNTTKNSNSNPPNDFQTSGGGQVTTAAGFRTNAGLAQQLKWGGGRYQVSMDGGRNTTNSPTDQFNPRLSSNLNFNYTQPLLRNFSIDSTRQQLLSGQKQREIVDVQLQQQITTTARNVRIAYYDLVGAIAGLEVAKQSRELAQQQFRNNQRKVEVGTLAPIEIVQAQAEVSRTEEQVIIAEGQIQSLEDRLRTLVLNPSQPDFWTVRIEPTEQPTLTPQALDVDGAIRNALAIRSDLVQARKQIEQTDIGIKFAGNQRLPSLDAIVNYGLAGVGGTQFDFDGSSGIFPPPVLSQTNRSFSDALRDVFGNQFKTWSVQFQLSYPIGTSAAETALASQRLQRQQQTTGLQELELQVTQAVREAARSVNTSLKRVEATRSARGFAEQRLEAEEKRMAVGLSTTFELVQAQRDLAAARQSELNAILSYNRALIGFQAVQSVPVNGQ